MSQDLFDRIGEVLADNEVDRKLARLAALIADWGAGRVACIGSSVEPPLVRGYPARPVLVQPQDLPRRSPGTPEGRAALIHSIAHIEYSAIDLALDHAFRFRDMPTAYRADWLRVAADEARHFVLLREHLRGFGFDYGDFPAHDALWQMALKSADDALLRMALVPRLLEARGLDATPTVRAKLAKIGDEHALRVLDIILHDEVEHVAIGDRWFRQLCAGRGLEPEATFRRLVVEHGAPWPQSPMNEKARLAAGFGEAELARLALGPNASQVGD